MAAHATRDARLVNLSLVLPFFTALGCSAAAPDDRDVPAEPESSTSARLAMSLRDNRDRLLASYGERFGKSSCQMWSEMTQVQKGVFLTITDLLGKRSFLTNDVASYTRMNWDSCSEPETDCTYGCSVDDPNWSGWCAYVDGFTCWQMGKCYRQDVPRSNFETALDHVTRIWAINGNSCPAWYPSCECGGGDKHRIYFSADDSLIGSLRNRWAGLPEWDHSGDVKGPHPPFNNTSETFTEMDEGLGFRAGGQTHFWSYDWQAQWMSRPGVEGVYDPHLVEIDIDYKWSNHDSNPECFYSGEYGRNKYTRIWQNHGFGGPPEYEYVPSGC